jgi:hypothetical protein
MQVRFTVLPRSGDASVLRAEVTGSLVDVTEGGVGLLTTFPVERDQIVRFDSIAPEHGKVVWTTRIAGRSRAGIAFLHPAAVAELIGEVSRPALVAS